MLNTLQDRQTAHEAQYQKKKQSNQKTPRRPKKTILQRRHTDGQLTHACESVALNMPTNLENSAVATGLEKVSFH